MDYTAKELASTLGLNAKYIRETLIAELGAPCRRDEKGHIFVNGPALYKWALEMQAERNTAKKATRMKEAEFFCVTCKARVTPASYQIQTIGTKAIKRAICPLCGGKINKLTRKENNNDQSE